MKGHVLHRERAHLKVPGFSIVLNALLTRNNRIEVADGTAFFPEQYRVNKARSYSSKMGFKYYLDHLLGNEFL